VSSAGEKGKKILPAVIYLLSALTLAFYLDSLYGLGGPNARYPGAVYVAVASAIVFVGACLLSLF
jgi:hypothetical protein